MMATRRPVGAARRGKTAVLACLFGLVGLLAAVFVGGGSSAVANPIVSGPITGGTHGFPFMSSALDLSQYGYTEEEYFLEGTATHNQPASALTSDGIWMVTSGPDSAAFKTRILVRKPVDARQFNGIVILEWLNVTAGFDFTGDWFHTRFNRMNDGFAYIGVSAQRVGVNFLKNWETGASARYASLNHPGDSFSYDIYSQVAEAIRHPQAVNPLAGLNVKYLVADGLSQSASRLLTYYNAVQPRERLFDAFFVHSRGGTGAALTQAPQAAVPSPPALWFRTDEPTPVLLLETETDVQGLGYFPARQPDSATFRDWEVAAAAHADAFWQDTQLPDSTKSGVPFFVTCSPPINAGLTHHWVMDAADMAIKRWLETGTPPTSAPRFQVNPGPPATLVRDALGNVVGGIRLPDVEAPLAAHSGITTSTNGFCSLYGQTAPFSDAQIMALYPNHGSYVSKYKQAANDAAKQGFLLKSAAQELTTAAAQSDIGK
jgi:Alpha/beta hydrolase domain